MSKNCFWTLLTTCIHDSEVSHVKREKLSSLLSKHFNEKHKKSQLRVFCLKNVFTKLKYLTSGQTQNKCNNMNYFAIINPKKSVIKKVYSSEKQKRIEINGITLLVTLSQKLLPSNECFSFHFTKFSTNKS